MECACHTAKRSLQKVSTIAAVNFGLSIRSTRPSTQPTEPQGQRRGSVKLSAIGLIIEPSAENKTTEGALCHFKNSLIENLDSNGITFPDSSHCASRCLSLTSIGRAKPLIFTIFRHCSIEGRRQAGVLRSSPEAHRITRILKAHDHGKLKSTQPESQQKWARTKAIWLDLCRTISLCTNYGNGLRQLEISAIRVHHA